MDAEGFIDGAGWSKPALIEAEPVDQRYCGWQIRFQKADDAVLGRRPALYPAYCYMWTEGSVILFYSHMRQGFFHEPMHPSDRLIISLGAYP